MNSVKFGTSGLRGLSNDLTDDLCQRYVSAFLTLQIKNGSLNDEQKIFVGCDLRESSSRILRAVIQAIVSANFEVANCGQLPTPALALEARQHNTAAIMITGSHIPADRNGLKFYSSKGEITKIDEENISALLPNKTFIKKNIVLPPNTFTAIENYRQRALNILPYNALSSMRIGIYQQSSVARDILSEVIQNLGAQVVNLKRSQNFVALDTEAIDKKLRNFAQEACHNYKLDALISTDGDGDRPLITDHQGQFIHGDIIGMITAKFLNANTVITPVTSTSLVETSKWFNYCYRCKVGSPYVIAAMDEAEQEGSGTIVGFEANGGVLLGTDVILETGLLKALPTRDAILPILSVLGFARMHHLPLNALTLELPRRYTASQCFPDICTQQVNQFLQRLNNPVERYNFFKSFGTISDWDTIDGLRVTFQNGDIIHFRPSGNAPELRCYSESCHQKQADLLVEKGLRLMTNEIKKLNS